LVAGLLAGCWLVVGWLLVGWLVAGWLLVAGMVSDGWSGRVNWFSILRCHSLAYNPMRLGMFWGLFGAPAGGGKVFLRKQKKHDPTNYSSHTI